MEQKTGTKSKALG